MFVAMRRIIIKVHLCKCKKRFNNQHGAFSLILCLPLNAWAEIKSNELARSKHKFVSDLRGQKVIDSYWFIKSKKEIYDSAILSQIQVLIMHEGHDMFTLFIQKLK